MLLQIVLTVAVGKEIYCGIRREIFTEKRPQNYYYYYYYYYYHHHHHHHHYHHNHHHRLYAGYLYLHSWEKLFPWGIQCCSYSLLLFMVLISLVSVMNLLHFYLSTFRNMCAVTSMVVFWSSLISCLPGMLFTYFLYDWNSPRRPCVLLLLVSSFFIIIIIIIIIYAIVPNTCPHHLGSNLAPRTHHVMA